MTNQRTTASERLDRLLYILPAATGAGGCDLEELARTLETTRSQVVRDLQEVIARDFYHPSGGAENIQITLDGSRVKIRTTGEFRRPPKLTAREALALGLGFRVVAADEGSVRRTILQDMATRLEELAAAESAEQHLEQFGIDRAERGGSRTRTIIRDAATTMTPCRIEYLKRNAESASERDIHPYAVMRADAGWYAIAHCTSRNDIRVFRLDRVLSVTTLPGTFEVPPDFDANEWIAQGGRIYRSEDDVEVVVRYSSRVARWLRERGPVDEHDDGSVVVRHRVADTGWIIQHVLQYGPDAEILEPAECRAAVAGLLRRMAG